LTGLAPLRAVGAGHLRFVAATELLREDEPDETAKDAQFPRHRPTSRGARREEALRARVATRFLHPAGLRRRHGAAVGRQAEVAPPLVVERRVGTLHAFDDQALVDEALDDAV